MMIGRWSMLPATVRQRGAIEISRRISEEIYFHALWASTELAEVSGAHEGFSETRLAKGQLQFDLWGVTPTDPARWQTLRDRIAEFGVRNSLYGLKLVEKRESLLNAGDVLEAAALDRYSFTRDVYLQVRSGRITPKKGKGRDDDDAGKLPDEY